MSATISPRGAFRGKWILGLLVWLLLAVPAGAVSTTGLAAFQQGAVELSDTSAYDWHYGCSPTSAGMLLAQYDRNGYDGMSYANLIPGGPAETTNFGSPAPLAEAAIASSGHVADFYANGYNASGDDVANPRNPSQFDCLADFMGTSQDACGNSNGGTTFYNYTNGAPLSVADVVSDGSIENDTSGLFGIWEYLNHAGYGAADPASETGIYNQYIDGYGNNTLGFTFNDYIGEIDAGRGVLVHVEGHTMYGYGYDDQTSEILLYDTWNPGENRMTWGGSYSGMLQFGVTVIELSGSNDPLQSAIPEPMTFLAAGLSFTGLARYLRRRSR